MGLSEVWGILWRERQLIELLVSKLEEEQLAPGTSHPAPRPLATQEVETVREEIRRVELLRSVAVDAVAPTLGLEPGASLKALSDAATPPWRRILEAHRAAVSGQVALLDRMAPVHPALVDFLR